MKTRDAVELIRFGSETSAQTWCDLGCGRGVFTIALAELLPSRSIIYAIDREKRFLDEIPERHQGVLIRKVAADFLSEKFQWPAINGVLMANSLHFVKEQGLFLRRVLNIAKRFLVVEYDRSSPSRWHPYPLNYASLQTLLLNSGYDVVTRLGTYRSSFGGEMYAAIAELSDREEPK